MSIVVKELLTFTFSLFQVVLLLYNKNEKFICVSELQVFQGKAYLLSSRLDHEKGVNVENDTNKTKQQRTNLIKQNTTAAESETSADEQLSLIHI